MLQAGRSRIRLRMRSLGLSIDLLRHYATSRKVEGSNPDEVIGVFN
jgi:hypothetical protein